MEMNEYFELLTGFGIDVEKDMELFEKVLKETNGRTHSFLSGGGLRVLRHEKNGKLYCYGESFNFENGLKNFFKNLNYREENSRQKLYKAEYLTGSTAIGSPIDQWFLNGRKIDIKAEKGNGGFLIEGRTDTLDAPLLSVSNKKLLTAFEMFNAYSKNLSDWDIPWVAGERERLGI
jgi:hypothetical protein